MQIKYVTGNLLTSPEEIIVHGCNIYGKMGGGIAKSIRDKWPEVYSSYVRRYNKYGLTLGEIQVVDLPDGPVVVNAMTQVLGGDHPVSYDAVYSAFLKINTFMKGREPESKNWPTVGMPRIGAGLGGGKWTIIAAIIETTATDYQPVVYDYTPPKEG